ncbi:MAG: NAD-dependent DNA ligase LigA, partial [Clostridia bacterium]|nr:NAD-dependent DNA ligase LigA [Clostridia bacterium]
CPYCGATLTETGANLFCPNPHCRPRVVAKLANFACKNGMNIDGFSAMTAGQLYDSFAVEKISDLASLDKEKVSLLEGFGTLKTDNLFNAIEASENVDFSNFIFALGIDNVGKKTAGDIAAKFRDINGLKSATVDDLLAVEDIGAVIAQCVYDYFRDEKNIEEINKLLALGVKISAPATQNKEGVFGGEKVVLTGTLSKYKRDEAAKIIEREGGEVMSGVSKKTTLVLAGENAGSKLDKARVFGIKIIDETEFENLIKV